ncbi:SGNH/GDSL hydrolase family protein [Agrobacterium sp. ICMP 6402]|uniref:SGNH/GDSL hydrolase family protein n=1 Tax=Agrobacterium sp. ICMP 6402 TaxID=2292443 RepID=UPI001294D2C1|nr:SGNH/GDSL hydrolase family protein [Agrobacterium sp. ICMP 6402]
MKAKLSTGQNASILIIGDSTSYTQSGPYYLFAAWLGAQHNATVRIRRWAEWGATGAADGPKDYAAPETVALGTGSVLDIWLAALPGAYPNSMFHKGRRSAAIDALSRPDLVIWHHGHNVQTYEVPIAGLNAQGRGLYLGPIGMVGYKWPGLPQAIVNQTPWRDNAGMDKIVSAINEVRAAKPDITVVNSHDPFLPFKADALYYRVAEPFPGVHPSDADGRNLGAQLQTSALMAAWGRSEAVAGFTSADWVRAAGTNLMPNGDFAWPGANPTGWSNGGTTAVLVKNTTEQYPGYAYCVEIQPGATPAAARMTRAFTEAETAPLRGKTLSLAILAKHAAGQTPPYMGFVTRFQSPPGRTVVAGPLTANALDRPLAGEWCWYVASGIPVDADAGANLMAVSLYPTFNAAGNGGSLFIQKAVLVEGLMPKGLMP